MGVDDLCAGALLCDSPSLELRERRTGTLNITLSLLRLFTASVGSVGFFGGPFWHILIPFGGST